MKSQDILFFVLLAALLFFGRSRPYYFALAGLIAISISIPLFSFWVFFTAERLVWYAGVFFFFAAMFSVTPLFKNKKGKSSK